MITLIINGSSKGRTKIIIKKLCHLWNHVGENWTCDSRIEIFNGNHYATETSQHPSNKMFYLSYSAILCSTEKKKRGQHLVTNAAWLR